MQVRVPPVETVDEEVGGEWSARPVLGWIVRIAIVAIPIAVSWLSVRAAIVLYPRPAGWWATAAWIGAALVLSFVVHAACRRVLRRFSPLGMLFNLALTFPTPAPSRLRSTALASRSDDLREELTAEGTDWSGGDRNAKALVQLVIDINRHDSRMWGHNDRVRAYSEAIGEELGLDTASMQKLRWAALLHDTGKLDVSPTLLASRRTLTADELDVVREHTAHGAARLAPFVDWLGEWALVAAEHHERWDGAGYPLGLAGDEISIGARIVAVADAYDAMTASRSYRRAIAPAKAREELVAEAGAQFDPSIVSAFLRASIRERRFAIGPLAALVELPARLLAATPTGAAAVSVAAATSAAVVGVAVVPPLTEEPAGVERVVVGDVVEDAPVEVVEPTTTTTTEPPSTTTTTERPTTTTIAPTTTTSTTTTTTSVAPTTTAPPATTTSAAPTTTTTAAPTTTTTTEPPDSYPTVPPTTTTTTAPPPEYPSV